MVQIPAITLQSLSFSWPDGSRVLHDVTGSFTTGSTGLIGDNGSGKSTLLKLIAGQLAPSSGRVKTSAEVGYLAQTLTLEKDSTVAQLLGIDTVLAALRAIEAGSIEVADFDAVGQRWDIESRAEAELMRIGFTAADLGRPVAQLSGGESMLIAVIGLRLAETGITLLDEPTNNLDRDTRQKLYGLLESWPGTLLVVSHDTGLLERMEHTAELHSGQLSVYGGPYSTYLQQLGSEQQAAQQAARTAEAQLKVEKRQRIEAETKLARRQRAGRAAQLGGGLPKAVSDHLRKKSQASAGSLRSNLDSKVDSAQAAVDAADARVRQEEHINLVLPDPQVPRSKRIAEFSDMDTNHVMQGPERVGLVGPNGSGKTSLLHRLLALPNAKGGGIGARLFTERTGYLPQRLDGLDESASAIQNVRLVAPGASPGQIRNSLARLLLRGASVDRALSTLSGGERFRVHLATLLLAEPVPQLLVLDEPTNNLDLASIEQLVQALSSYRGALLVVSHDDRFLASLGLDYLLEIADGRLQRKGPPKM